MSDGAACRRSALLAQDLDLLTLAHQAGGVVLVTPTPEGWGVEIVPDPRETVAGGPTVRADVAPLAGGAS